MTGWRLVRGTLLTVGLGIAVYLTWVHLSGSEAVCPASGGLVNCSAVLSSAYASVWGVPVAIWGVLYFAVGLIVLFTTRGLGPMLHAALGAAAVLYLVFVELYEVGALCLWCTGVHAVIIANWLILMFIPDAP